MLLFKYDVSLRCHWDDSVQLVLNFIQILPAACLNQNWFYCKSFVCSWLCLTSPQINIKSKIGQRAVIKYSILNNCTGRKWLLWSKSGSNLEFPFGWGVNIIQCFAATLYKNKFSIKESLLGFQWRVIIATFYNSHIEIHPSQNLELWMKISTGGKCLGLRW